MRIKKNKSLKVINNNLKVINNNLKVINNNLKFKKNKQQLFLEKKKISNKVNQKLNLVRTLHLMKVVLIIKL